MTRHLRPTQAEAGTPRGQQRSTDGAWTTAIVALAAVAEIAWLGVLTWTAMELTR